MKIIVAPDSFKESLSAKAVASAISKGILKVLPKAEIMQIPISDGGEGLLDALVEVLGGERFSVFVKDPLLRKIKAEYAIIENGKTAIIEMAQASGLVLLKKSERSPLHTSTYGTGQLILDALDRGCTKIIIGIGGSATNDGGMGMVKALGGKFVKKNNQDIGYGGKALADLYKIDLSKFDKRIVNCEIITACDVTNPLTGVNGASIVYGGQKGGTADQLKKLDNNLIHYASIIRKNLRIEVETIKGAGAAGGMGAALLAFFDAKLVDGIDLILKTLRIEEHIINSDLIITGEGKIDEQTLNGKAIVGLARIAKINKVPLIAIAGKLGEGIEPLNNEGIHAVFSIVDQPMKLSMALKNADKLIENLIENIMRTLTIKF
ncbi:MAG: glycerate kinase [Flavobacteriaceae bacterium]|nr:glycerate kinase [Flavobacteriaceae bacterium]